MKINHIALFADQKLFTDQVVINNLMKNVCLDVRQNYSDSDIYNADKAGNFIIF